MMNQSEHINRWPLAMSTAILGLLILWPDVLLPAAHAVTGFCEGLGIHHFLIQYCPPYLVAFLSILALVAGGITLAMLLRQFCGHRRLHRYLLAHRHQPDGETRDLLQQLGSQGTILVFSGSEPSAFCSGLIKPRAYVSTGLIDLLDRSELEAVLRHELYHVRQRDPLRLFLGRLIGIAGILIPVLRVIEQRYQVQIELAADRAALSAIPIETLASALIRVGRGQTRLTPALATAGFSTTEARISALLGQPAIPSPRLIDIGVTGAIALILIGLSWWLTTLPLDHAQSCPACPLLS